MKTPARSRPDAGLSWPMNEERQPHLPCPHAHEAGKPLAAAANGLIHIRRATAQLRHDEPGHEDELRLRPEAVNRLTLPGIPEPRKRSIQILFRKSLWRRHHNLRQPGGVEQLAPMTAAP